MKNRDPACALANAEIHVKWIGSKLVMAVWTWLLSAQRTAEAALRGADQNTDPEHDEAAEHDLEHRLQERRIHVAGADIGDRPQFE
jgi:hypothetical protein